jgi:hypothetical protein
MGDPFKTTMSPFHDLFRAHAGRVAPNNCTPSIGYGPGSANLRTPATGQPVSMELVSAQVHFNIHGVGTPVPTIWPWKVQTP